MSDELKYFDRIEAYSNGEMDEAAKVVFEAELASNSELNGEWEAYQASQKVLEFLAYDALSEDKKTPAKQREDKAKVIRLLPLILAAASIVMLLGIASLFWLNWSDDEQWATAYYQQPIPDINRGEVATKENDFQIAFFEENYERTIALLEEVENASDYQMLLIGHSYLKTEEFEKAIEAYSKIISKRNSEWNDQARWHQILAHLEKEDFDAASTQLEYFTNQTDHPLNSLANEIQKSIRNND
ncbi:MAG: hypothetical protein AAFO07_09430 [Bacteroidota bacterium]